MILRFNSIFIFFCFLFFLFFIYVFQSVFLNGLVSDYIVPDLVMVVVAYIGLRRNLLSGLLWTFFISYIYHLNSSLDFVPTVMLMLIGLFISRYIARNFYLLSRKEYFLSLVVPILAQKIILYVALLYGGTYFSFKLVFQILATTLSSALLGLLIFRVLTKFDIWAGKLDSSTLIGKKV